MNGPSSVWRRQTAPLEKITRRFKSSNVFVLNPRVSGVVPNRRPALRSQTLENNPAIFAEAMQLDQKLLRDQQIENNRANSVSLQSLINDQLQRQAPLVKQVGSSLYEDLQTQLDRGYTKKQLLEYLKTQNVYLPARFRKPQIIQALMQRIWKVKLTDARDLPADFVEKHIQLSDRSLFFIVSQGGKLMRTWTKSGAQMWLLEDKQELLVRTSQETFDWIAASVHRLEENLYSEVIPLTHYRDVAQIDSETLKLIQRLSNCYLMMENENHSENAILYSMDYANILLARRLLTSNVPLPNWRSRAYLYDTNQDNLPHCQFSLYGQLDSLLWRHSGMGWTRWERVKTRQPRPLLPPKMAKLRQVDFSDRLAEENNLEDSVFEHLNVALGSLGDGAVTLTAVPGFLLHAARQASALPNASLQKSFTSNVPYLSRLAASLPLNDADVLTDFSEPKVEAKSASDSTLDDLWDLVLNKSRDKVFTSKKHDFKPQISKMLQVSLIPTPFAAGNNVHQFPPIELWTEITSGTGVNTDQAKAVAVHKEDDLYVSLTQEACDVKISATNSIDLAVSEPIRQYLDAVRLGKESPEYVPAQLALDFNGHTVEYQTVSATSRTQLELNYQGLLLQLSRADNSIVEGSRIEATLVNHWESGLAEVDSDAIRTFAKKTLAFIREISEMFRQS